MNEQRRLEDLRPLPRRRRLLDCKTLADIVLLDTVVTVVDTPNFMENYESRESIGARPDLAG